MSECVVRMPYPKDCESCHLKTRNFFTGDLICAKTHTFLPASEKNNNCPIICQLPEGHGRLVDENEVKDWVENWLCVNKYYHPYSSSNSIPVSELYDVFQRMDAAVPAERSE